MFNFYIAKASASFGITSTREIYERAIEVLPDREAKEMCLKYAELERKLGEIDRARAVYAHASQFCDPRVREIGDGDRRESVGAVLSFYLSENFVSILTDCVIFFSVDGADLLGDLARL